MHTPLVSLNRFRHVGLLLLRLGVGATFIVHGASKLLGGSEVLVGVGSVVTNVGITGGHYAFGLLAALLEAVGGLLLMLGLFTRLAAVGIGLVMIGALMSHAANDDPVGSWLPAVRSLAVMLAVFFTGAGRYSLDALMTDRETLEAYQPPSDVIQRRREPAWSTREHASDAQVGRQG